MRSAMGGVMLFLSLTAFAQHNFNSKEVNMSAAAQNKEAVKRMYEECFNTGKFEMLTQFIGEAFTSAKGTKGVEGFKEGIQPLKAAFPDIQWTIEDLVAEGDRVTIKSTWRGTHQGKFGGFEATGKKVAIQAITIYQLKDNKIIQSWLMIDRLGFHQQIGVLPEDLTTLKRSTQRQRKSVGN
jgi:steroid delta-isomerase-like uncharacterized protein